MELRIAHLSRSFKDKKAVDDLSYTLTPGVYGLLGANGAGKTTLMRMLSAVLRPDSGRIWYNHGDIHELNEAYRSRLGYLPQHFGCYPGFTGRRFLHYLGALKGLERDHVKERTEWLLQEVGLAQEADRKVSTYSGGMKQRLGIAQALLNDPRVLILDEPTAGLDPRERVRFRNLISALADRRIILLSTHIVSDVEYIADEILMMREGKLIHTGNPEKIICPMQGKVWECHSDAAGAKALSRQHTIANLRREKDAVVLRVIAEHPPMPQARMLTPTLEDLYPYCFGEEQDDAHADRI